MSEETKRIIEKINSGELEPLEAIEPNEPKRAGKVRLIEEIFKIAAIVCLVVALALASMARNNAQERAEEQAQTIAEHKANEERLTAEVVTATERATAKSKELVKARETIASLEDDIEDLQTIITNQSKTIEEQETELLLLKDTDPIPYTQDDINILAAVMYGEEYPNRYEMMLAGSVVLNRVKSPDFPNTIYEVVHQKNAQFEQYAPRTKGFIGKELPAECYELAEILLRHGSIAPASVVYQAHFNQGEVFWEWQGEEFCFGR